LVASRPGVIGAYERLSPDATDEAARNTLEAIARSFLPYGFTAVDFLDLQDGPLATIGSYRRNAALRVTLSGPGSPQLLWDRGFYLQSSQPIFSNGVKVGSVKTEQPMTGLTRLSATAVEWGETGEVTLCAAASEKMACFPTRFRSTAETMARSVGNQPVPMSHALDGEAGVVKVRDRGGQRVLAAYRPVGSTGLGIVMTLQLAEVYAPLRSGFAAILPLLVLLVILSSVLTRWRMRPVLAQMAASERAVAESENRFRIACESGIDAFLILESVRSGQGTIVDFLVSYVNRNAEKLLGRPRSQLLNQSLGSALPMLLNSGWFDRYKKVVDSGRPSDAEQTVDVPNVAANWVHQHIVPLGDGVAVTLTDISERKRLEQDLRRMAQSDALTELPNRALFLDRLERAMIRARGANDLLAVLSIDVDHFQAFNKEHGHSEGDIVLKTFATRLTDGVRVEDTVARVGGDEFGIILEGLAARSQAFSAAEAILATLRKEIGLTDKTVSVTGSMGIALYSGENTTATKLLERADLALEEVKRRGQDAYYAAEATFARPPHRA
jgi:diguanylate cyclase (GGDEF)-like protein